MSRVRSEMNGNAWLGYSKELQALDDIYNMNGLHMQVTAGAKKPKTDHFKQPPQTTKKPVSNVSSFNIAGLAAQINK